MTLVAIFSLTVVNILFAAFTLMHMWGWFVAPLGVMNLTFFHALGLWVLCTFIVPRQEREPTIEFLSRRTINIGLVLLIGSFVQLYV